MSLVPSQTELLYDLQFSEAVVGITKFCVHPQEWFRHKTRVGGTKDVDIQKIYALQPHLIIANKEENVQQQIEALALDFPVWVTDVNTLDDALAMITDIGQLTCREKEAYDMVKNIENAFAVPKTIDSIIPAAYLIWKDPYMCAGADTFINDMMQHAGFENVFSNKTRYPEVTISQVQKAGCKILLLSSEPYPFRQKHMAELKNELKDVTVMLVDGEMFSWYGSRLLKAPAYFQKLHALLLQPSET